MLECISSTYINVLTGFGVVIWLPLTWKEARSTEHAAGCFLPKAAYTKPRA